MSISICFTAPPENIIPEEVIGKSKKGVESWKKQGDLPDEILIHFVGMKLVVAKTAKQFAKMLKEEEGSLSIDAYLIIKQLKKKLPKELKNWFDENGLVYTKESVGKKGFCWILSSEYFEIVK